MAPEVTFNRTAVIHPCYEVDMYDAPSKTRSSGCVLLNIFLCLLSVIIICGNLLIIITVVYFKQLHTPTNYLILSLAVADLLVGVLLFPLSIEFTLSYCVYQEEVICKVRNSIDVTLSTASILHLCCISIDRYHAVCKPLTYRTTLTVQAVAVMILLSWTLSLLVAAGFVVAEFNYAKCGEECYVDILIANIVGVICSFYIPVIIMICIYAKIFLVAQNQARSIQNTNYPSRTPGANVSKMERKATKTLTIVMGVFLICWTPFCIYISVQLFNQVPIAVGEGLTWLALSNSMLNPFIYAFFYSWFQSAFKILILGKVFQSNFSRTRLN
ncbi:trace amine-associated receptor 1-like [Entelurus aequoreus]|uniref:trace amine-associated receptor 1-like n=1 Tax=Entelurus aequoreus TaxID=161455 RepID=UPI002B1CFBD6|nr:trace amine-associated receptor 1-like [Entelurus aequoreus]XP_061890285.1 trace amine-associated receptor 1-like [Entelurus aequoreus]